MVIYIDLERLFLYVVGMHLDTEWLIVKPWSFSIMHLPFSVSYHTVYILTTTLL